MRDEAQERSERPGGVLLQLWFFALALALYCAEDVYSRLAFDAGSPRAQAVGRAILDAGQATGFVSLRKSLDDRFATLRDPPVLLAEAPGGRPEPLVTDTAGGSAAALASIESPRRILLAGASSIEFHFGVELERCLEAYSGVTVHRSGKLGTGLARPQDFDWTAGLDRIAGEAQPDLVIGQFGGNDCRAAVDPATGRRWRFDTPPWRAEYGRRVASLVKVTSKHGARSAFLGQLAVMRPGNRKCFARIDDATQEAAERAGADFFSLRELTLAGEDKALESVTDARGVRQRMWIRDDLHLSRAGAVVVAGQVCSQLERHYALDTGDPENGRVYRFETASAALARTVPWYAVVPREIPDGGVPVLYLLHGGGGNAGDWMREQEALQRLAVTHRIAFVVPDGGEWSWYANGLAAGSAVETFFVRELLPDVEARLPVSGARGIAGLSMGGHGALSLAVRNPGLFRSASSLSGVVDLLADPSRTGQTAVFGTLPENRQRWEEHSVRHLLEDRPAAFRGLALRLDCGDRDRFLAVNRELRRALVERGIAHVYEEGSGAHDWTYWSGRLPAQVAWHAEALRRSQ